MDFFKVSGSGNDFLALVEPEPETEPRREEIAAWCRRGLSEGADGLFVLRRAGAGRVRMTHYNADGGGAELCVNGTRCAARLAFHLGWAEERVEVETGAGVLAARLLPDGRVELEIPPPPWPPEERDAELESALLMGWYLEVGVPHFVLPWPESLAAAPVAELGPDLVHHPVFGGSGANIDFVRFPDLHTLEIRTWERGVGAETLACGTGILAATAVGLHHERLALPVTAHTQSGFPLNVDGQADDDGRPLTWTLTGDARLLTRGTLLPDAAHLPPPPRWG